MPINSANQSIKIRYGDEVTSEGVNEKIRDIFGNKGRLEGMNLSPLSGLDCQLSPGKIIINGVSIEETQNITIPIPENSSGSDVTHYLYAFYTHGAGESCYYDLLTSTTSSQNALLISTIIVPDGASEIISGNISNEPLSNKSSESVVFSDFKNKDVQDINSISINGKVITVSDGDIYIDGAKVWSAENDGAGSGLDADTLDLAQKSIDDTLFENSDNKIPTEKAIKTYLANNYPKIYVGPTEPENPETNSIWIDTSV
jgi:hypothetical protein